MSDDFASESGREFRLVYWICGAIALALVIGGFIAYDAKADSAEARQKASQLSAKLQQAGLPVPDQDILVRTLGDDGGSVCEDPGGALRKAIAHDMIANGASHVGRRPVIGDPRLVQGQRLVMETYCPDELEDFREEFDDLKTDDVVKD
jgi:hypothetical protein